MTDETPIAERPDPTQRKMPPEIIKARIAVMAAAIGVDKSGHNNFHNYDYASDKDVLSLVQPLMAKNGLALEMWPTGVEGPDDNGNMRVLFAMQWQHESGVMADPIPWYGIAQDRDKQGRMGDKWFNKALTAAEKYFLLKQFHIPAGKEADPDNDKDDEKPPFQSNAKPQNGNGKAPPKQEPHPDALGATDYKAGLRAFEQERNTLLTALRGREITAEEANDRYREIRGGILKISVNGKDKTVKTEALLKQCQRSPSEWRDREKDDFVGFERRLKETREELDRALAKNSTHPQDDPFSSESQEAAQ